MLSFIVVFIGFFSVFSQSVFIKELLINFSGNELYVGILLSFWLFFTGIGSLVFSKFFPSSKNDRSLLFFFMCVFFLLGFFEFLSIKALRFIWNVYPGEIPPPLYAIVSSFLILAPFAFINGMLFSLSVRIYFSKTGIRSVGKVYSLDSLGDMLGGVVFSFIFAPFMGGLESIYFLVLIALVILFILFPNKRIVVGIMIIIFVFAVGFNMKKIDDFFVKKNWQGFEVIEKATSIYGDLVLVKRKRLYSLFNNGILSLNFPLRIKAEEIAHISLLQVKNPKRILVIGAGIAGLLSEILKHSVEEIYYLEVNPKLINMVKNYIPYKDRIILDSDKVKIINQDPRYFLNIYRGDKFDAVFMNMPSPLNIYLNRFYTYEFFLKLKEILNKKGILILSLPLKEGYIPPSLLNLLSSVYHTLKKVFPYIILIPDEELRLIASGDSFYLTDDPMILGERLEERKIVNQYVNKYYFFSKLLPWHIKYTAQMLDERNPSLNYDFRPTSYCYAIRYFFSRFGSPFFPFCSLSLDRSFWYGLLFCIFLVTFLFFRKKGVLVFSLFGVGFAGLSSVVISIIAFQIIYGYVYHKIGLLSASFMLGLSIGSNWVNRRIEKISVFCLFLIPVVLGEMFILFPIIFRFLFSFLFSPLQVVLFLISFLSGVLVGAFFPLASREYTSSVTKKIGILYFCDLVGGAMAGILVCMFFLPLYGIMETCMLLGFSLLVMGLFLFLSIGKAKRTI